MNQLFGGILQSQVRCLVCCHVSATWDPCMDISLELGAACSSVEDALSRFTAAEKLDGDNKYRWVCGVGGARVANRAMVMSRSARIPLLPSTCITTVVLMDCVAASCVHIHNSHHCFHEVQQL